MKRLIFALLVLSVVFASFDQTYVQEMNRNGASTIEKTMDVSIFAGQLSKNAFEKMNTYCQNAADIICSVDADKKIVTIKEKFISDVYYSFSADYGIPYTTYVLEIDRVPTNVFSQRLEAILVAIGEANASNDNPSPIDLRDQQTNSGLVQPLEILKVNITYVVEMPSDIESATAGTVKGNINGARASFDIVDVMGESQPMVIVSKEINYGYILAIFGVVVLLAMAYWFVVSSKQRRTAESKKKSTIKK